jgi:hypothetical protein
MHRYGPTAKPTGPHTDREVTSPRRSLAYFPPVVPSPGNVGLCVPPTRLPPTSVSKSPIETTPNSALAAAEILGSVADWRSTARSPSRGSNAELRPQTNRGRRTRKRPETSHYVEVTHLDRMRSSGGLLRSRDGIPRSGLSSIQHAGSNESRPARRVRVSVGSASARPHLAKGTRQAGLGRRLERRRSLYGAFAPCHGQAIVTTTPSA